MHERHRALATENRRAQADLVVVVVVMVEMEVGAMEATAMLVGVGLGTMAEVRRESQHEEGWCVCGRESSLRWLWMTARVLFVCVCASLCTGNFYSAYDEPVHVHVVDANGDTPLDLARRGSSAGHIESAQLLLRYARAPRTKAKATDTSSSTPFQHERSDGTTAPLDTQGGRDEDTKSGTGAAGGGAAAGAGAAVAEAMVQDSVAEGRASTPCSAGMEPPSSPTAATADACGSGGAAAGAGPADVEGWAEDAEYAFQDTDSDDQSQGDSGDASDEDAARYYAEVAQRIASGAPVGLDLIRATAEEAVRVQAELSSSDDEE